MNRTMHSTKIYVMAKIYHFNLNINYLINSALPLNYTFQ